MSYVTSRQERLMLEQLRVFRLLDLLRQRTPEEITRATMALAPAFTPEMWRALELLRAERRLKEGI